jgi:YHS domain-containing protein
MILVAAILGVRALGEDTKEAKKPNPGAELKAQTHCPVMGGKIDSTVYTDIQGHRVYHCCPACIPKIKSDPDKYFKKAAAEGVLFENIQTKCPVSGEDLENKKVYLDYEGRRIFFCCSKCKAMFNEKDAMKYLKKMEETMPKPAEKKENHDGHNHG